MHTNLTDISGRQAGTIKLVGGRLCLDFINTVGFRDGRTFEEERFHDILDVVAWGSHLGLLTESEAAAAVSRYTQRPDTGAEQFSRAFRLREALYAILSSLMRGEQPPAGLLDLLNRELAEGQHNRLLGGSAGSVTWTWRSGISPVDRILWPVALSAAELLTEGDHSRLHQCKSDRCGWIFEDRSKNHSRRWCSMEECGNQAKVRRFRQAHKSVRGKGERHPA